MHKISVKPHQIGLLTLIAIGTILRLWDITEYSYWIDELYSAARAIPEKDFIDVYYWGPEPHPPAHYLLLWAAYNLFGYHEIVGKLISALAGVLCIPAIYYLGKIMFSRSVGVYAAIILTITPSLIYYSQEARPYELMVLFSILSSYLFFLIRDKKTTLRVILYICASIFLINLHFFGVWIFAAQIIFVATYILRSYKDDEVIFYFLLFTLIGASYIPLISQMLQAASRGGTWIPDVNVMAYIFECFSAYFGSHNIFRPYQNIEISFTGVLVFVIFIFSYIKMVSHKKVSASVTYISLVFLFIYLVSIVLGIYLSPIFNARNSLAALPFIILIIAWGIHSFEIKKGYGLFFLTALLIFSNLTFYKNFQREDWKSAIKIASDIPSPYDKKNHIYVGAWEHEWLVYKKWLKLDLPIVELKDLQLSSYQDGDQIWVLWATVKPEDLSNNGIDVEPILAKLEEITKLETTRAGLIQYKISK